MFIKSTIAALGALAVAVSSVAITPVEHQPAPADIKSRADDDTVQTQGNVQFSIGYTLCSWFVSDPWGGQGGSYTELLVASGDKEIGCVEMDNSPHVPAEGYDSGSNFFNIWNVCGMNINFYEKNGNWDFYENGGDGTLLGTCYPHNGADHYCLQAANGGACTPETIMKCYASGFAWAPCT
ncbi:hypothetical protein FQN54_007541 [Arachnomyces sp. PD_36]|nr:hypothetical protein FQN54_007541 [Arachnomyces sp. PD_36]